MWRIEQYGKWNYVTPTMIAEAVSYMSQFPAHNMHFIILKTERIMMWVLNNIR